MVCHDTPVGNLGVSICYDMRFPEMYVDLVGMGAQVLLMPSAFTVPTGKAHWHALLKGEFLYRYRTRGGYLFYQRVCMSKNGESHFLFFHFIVFIFG